jgi:hypothetical protein
VFAGGGLQRAHLFVLFQPEVIEGGRGPVGADFPHALGVRAEALARIALEFQRVRTEFRYRERQKFDPHGGSFLMVCRWKCCKSHAIEKRCQFRTYHTVFGANLRCGRRRTASVAGVMIESRQPP